MNYTPITEENIEKAAMLYMNHYNQHSGGCWTYEKAYKRIHNGNDGGFPLPDARR